MKRIAMVIVAVVICLRLAQWCDGAGCKKGCKLTEWIGYVHSGDPVCHNFHISELSWSDNGDWALTHDAPNDDRHCYSGVDIDYKSSCNGCSATCAASEVPQQVGAGTCGGQIDTTEYCDCSGNDPTP